jgi:hypothetical protein
LALLDEVGIQHLLECLELCGHLLQRLLLRLACILDSLAGKPSRQGQSRSYG